MGKKTCLLLAICIAATWPMACSDPKPLPKPELLIPSELRDHFVLTGDDATAEQRRKVFVYDSNIAVPKRDYRLVVLQGQMTDGAYQGVSMGKARIGDDGWEVSPVGGTVRFLKDRLWIELTGPEAKEWNGEYEKVSVVSKRVLQATAKRNLAKGPGSLSACQRYSKCVCDLANSGKEPFVKACADAKQLLDSAPEDPSSCQTGLAMFRKLAPGLGLALPATCASP